MIKGTNLLGILNTKEVVNFSNYIWFLNNQVPKIAASEWKDTFQFLIWKQWPSDQNWNKAIKKNLSTVKFFEKVN